MYNFRYHLITIVSIFAALAIGLLLGAAIAGSDLVRDTSNDMVDSLTARFDEITDENMTLRTQLNDDNLLATQLVESWAAKRMDGRTVCILVSDSSEDVALAESLRTAVALAGGATVVVNVSKPNFGLGDDDIKSELAKLVSAVQGEAYETTLARKLFAEWTYAYTSTSSDAPTAADNTIGPLPQPAKGAAQAQAPAPATAFQAAIYSHYPLTIKLLELEVIEIATDYRALLDHQSPQLQGDQLAAWRVAGAWQLPYASNGLIDTLVNGGQSGNLPDAQGGAQAGALATQAPSAPATDKVALALAEAYIAAGEKKELPYPAALRPAPVNAGGDSSDANAASALNEMNYHALLVQTGSKAQTLSTSARERNIACIVSLDGNSDAYNIVSLLTGGKRGVYGTSATDGRFPPMPTDASGRAAFSR